VVEVTCGQERRERGCGDASGGAALQVVVEGHD